MSNQGFSTSNQNIITHQAIILYDQVGGSNLYVSLDGKTFDLRGTAPAGSLMYAGGKYFSYGSGTTYVSTDAINWTSTNAGYHGGITYGNGIYLAGSSASAGTTTVKTSTDGITWTNRTAPAMSNANPPTFGNGVFFLNNAASGTTAASSTDGITWSVRTMPATGVWYRPTFGNGMFVTYISGATTMATSTDAITWTTRTSPATVSSNTFINGYFYMLSTYSGSRSTDLVTWQTLTIGPSYNGPFGISYANGGYYFTSQNTSVTAISTDGLTWTTGPTQPWYSNSYASISGDLQNTISPISLYKASYLNNVTSDIQTQFTNKADLASPTFTGTPTVPGYAKISSANTYTATQSFPSATIAPTMFFAAATGTTTASNVGIVSADGINWTNITMPTSSFWSGGTYGNGTFFAVSGGGLYGASASTTAASSTDGLTWTTRTMPASATWSASTFGNSTFVCIAGLNASTTTTAATSTDAITWTLRTMPAALCWRNVSYGNGNFVAIGQGANQATTTTAATSPDGITWTTRTMPVAASWSGITYGNGTFVAVAGGVAGTATTTAATSTDGITWVTRTMPTSLKWSTVVYSNGIFTAGATDSSTSIIATSTDGITWTTKTQQGGGNYYTGTLGAANGIIAGWQTGASGAYYGSFSSDNGTTWTQKSYLSNNTSFASPVGFMISVPSSQYKSSDLLNAFPLTITASSYTVQSGDRFVLINSGAIHTITLPNPYAYYGRELVIKQIAAFAVNSASSNVLPLTSMTAGTAILTGAGKFARLISNGQYWIVMESN